MTNTDITYQFYTKYKQVFSTSPDTAIQHQNDNKRQNKSLRIASQYYRRYSQILPPSFKPKCLTVPSCHVTSWLCRHGYRWRRSHSTRRGVNIRASSQQIPFAACEGGVQQGALAHSHCEPLYCKEYETMTSTFRTTADTWSGTKSHLPFTKKNCWYKSNVCTLFRWWDLELWPCIEGLFLLLDTFNIHSFPGFPKAKTNRKRCPVFKVLVCLHTWNIYYHIELVTIGSSLHWVSVYWFSLIHLVHSAVIGVVVDPEKNDTVIPQNPLF